MGRDGQDEYVSGDSGLAKIGQDDASVLVIGAGFGGLTAAMMLRKEGVKNFRIIERSAGVGGTWWNNSYPGAEVDVPSLVYSWNFKRFPWSRTHARQPELQRYVEEVVDEQDLKKYLTLNTSVTEMIWQPDLSQWHVTLSNGEIFNVDFVISAAGLLNVPRYPGWPGYDDFKGAKVHTAAWDSSIDLTDKRVAVVGVGSSATQVVATVAPIVKHLYVFQREPGWVLPKFDRAFTEEERQQFLTESDRERRKRRRKLFWETNKGMIFGRMYRPHTKYSKVRRAFAESYIASMFKDRPDLREAVTPTYAFAGKRTVANGDYYPALLRDNVTLIPRAVERLTETGVVDASGAETPIDVLIMATGFDPARALSAIHIVGREGQSLEEAWGDEPRAFFGITVPKFPNLFIMYGPNAHGGMIFTNHASQARWAILAIRAWRRGKRTFEARPSALARYVKWLDGRMEDTAWKQATSYFKNKRGAIITQWPLDAFAYMFMTRIFCRIGHKIR
jgi:cation diffusion facilitator CzcD-associated flavoprotein CzcO